MLSIVKPAKLQKGDHVAVIAPASSPDVELAKKAIRFLEQLGLEVHVGDSLQHKHGYLAGTDRQRLSELHQAFGDPTIKGIFSVCGGYGTARIGNSIDFELLRANPKIFWGYSDITFLLNAIFQETRLVTFHGPMLSSDLGKDVHHLTRETFNQLFFPQKLRYSNEDAPLKTYVEGKATGPLVGGNLSLLVSTLGTDFEIDTKNKVLFIEEVEEEPYRIDRMLNQLKSAGKFEEASAIVLCDFHNCLPKKTEDSLTLEQVFNDHIVPLGKPVLSGFSIGHCSPNLAVPIGIDVTLDADKKTLTFHETGTV
ncbi:LD-carboxypeptidase [Evansella sp. AB-rgal1]|uniref:S66 peptidase family protein n=1 Tax=Evansella sp. AB-rgal1 TaxID=3242696 RepID=UPI00359CDB58